MHICTPVFVVGTVYRDKGRTLRCRNNRETNTGGKYGNGSPNDRTPFIETCMESKVEVSVNIIISSLPWKPIC